MAAAVCAVYAARVYVQFDGARFKIVTAPVAAGAQGVRIDAEPASGVGALQTPFAMIARVRNNSSRPQAFTFQIDGRSVCTRTVGAGREQRIDCAVTGEWGAIPHHIDVMGPAESWALDYLELATHHGATRSYDLVIIPAISHHYVSPAPWAILVAGLLIALLFLVPPPRMHGWVLAVYRTTTILVSILFLLVFLSAFVSPFAVLLSREAFVEGVGLLAAPRLWVVGVSVGRWQRTTRWKPATIAIIVALLVLAAYGRLVQQQAHDRYDGNYSGFLHVSTQRFDADPMLWNRGDIRQTLVLGSGGGYDAQFMYLESFDPLLRHYRRHPRTYRGFIDNPPYRYGRIGFTWLTRLFSGGRWQRYPLTMVWLVLGGLMLAGMSLAWIARASGASPWWGLLILLVPGFWQSVQVALPEPIAAATLLGGYLCYVRGRYIWAGALLAASLLIRETGVIFVLAIVVATLMAGKRRDALTLAVVALLPIVVWRLYVGWMLWPDWGLEGILLRANEFTVPFGGFAQLWAQIAHGTYYPGVPGMARSGIWFPVVLTAGTALAAGFAILRPSAVSLTALAYGLMALSFNYFKVWVEVGNGERVTFELFIWLAVLSVGAGAARCPRILRRGLVLFWAGTAIYVLYGGPIAESIRQTIFG